MAEASASHVTTGFCGTCQGECALNNENTSLVESGVESGSTSTGSNNLANEKDPESDNKTFYCDQNEPQQIVCLSGEDIRPLFVEEVRPLSVEEVRPLFVEDVRPLFGEEVRPLSREDICPPFVEDARPLFVEDIRPLSRKRTQSSVRSKFFRYSPFQNSLPVYSVHLHWISLPVYSVHFRIPYQFRVYTSEYLTSLQCTLQNSLPVYSVHLHWKKVKYYETGFL